MQVLFDVLQDVDPNGTVLLSMTESVSRNASKQACFISNFVNYDPIVARRRGATINSNRRRKKRGMIRVGVSSGQEHEPRRWQCEKAE